MRRRYLMLLTLILFSLLSSVRFGIEREYSYRQSWTYCTEWLREGRLYGGQPFCVQGPVFFALLAMLSVFGESVPFFLTVLTVLIHASTFLILFTILKNKYGVTTPWLPLLLYISIIFYPFAFADIVTGIATFFGFLGYSILWHSSIQRKELFAGILFALALFTKLVVVPAIGIIIIYYLLKTREKKALLWLLLPSLILFGVFELLFPNMIWYLLVGSQYQPLGIIDLLKRVLYDNILLLNPFNWVVYTILGISFFAFFRKPTLPAAVSSTGLLVIFMIINNNVVYYARYYMLYYVFFILLVFQITSHLQKTLRNSTILFIFFVFVLPTAITITMDIWFIDLKQEVNKPLVFLKSYSGSALSEATTLQAHKTFLSPYYTYAQPLELLVPPLRVDDGAAPGFLHYGIVNDIKEAEDKVNEHIYTNNLAVLDKALNASYDLFIFGFPSWDTLGSYYDNIDPVLNAHYCSVIVPYLHYPSFEGRNYYFLYYKDTSSCSAFRNYLETYYNDHQVELCKHSKTFVNAINALVDIPSNSHIPCTDYTFFERLYKQLHTRRSVLS